MVATNDRPPFVPDVGLSPIDPLDLALVEGDSQLFSEFLEPFVASLHGQPPRIVKVLVDDLYAFYVADALAYLSRMLPPPPMRRRLIVGRPSPHFSKPTRLLAPDPEMMQNAPPQALAAWASHFRSTGGALLLEARALFHHLSVAQVFKAHNLAIPEDSLGAVFFVEELPTAENIRSLILQVFPPDYDWDTHQFAAREVQFSQAFQHCLTSIGVRYLRVAMPAEAERLEGVARAEGLQVADTMMRMQMRVDVYRKRRLEALAIFQDLVAPNLVRSTT
jgi:hypothetical protein